MTIGLSIIWATFAVLFFLLGRFYWQESRKATPPFKLTERKYASKESSIQVTITAAGTPLDGPLEDFAAQFNAYLEDQNSSSHKTNVRTAYGYFFAGATALFSALMESRDLIGTLLGTLL